MEFCNEHDLALLVSAHSKLQNPIAHPFLDPPIRQGIWTAVPTTSQDYVLSLCAMPYLAHAFERE